MDNILETICANKRLEVARQKEAINISFFEYMLSSQKREKVSFKQALAASDSGIIAEFKRRSPSKGWIHPDADVTSIVQTYEKSGAAAISCLTDEKFFGSRFDDFKKARAVIAGIPLLRKDFIVDEYQIYQSKVMGADVILLIAACLTQEETALFTKIAHELDMEVLLEIHSENELSYIQPDIDVVGINNRNLKTFETDIRHTIELANKIPDTFLKISESGLSDPQTVIDLRKQGFKGFLMGENFMRTARPGGALEGFIKSLSPRPPLHRERGRVTLPCEEGVRRGAFSPSPCGEGAGGRGKIKICGLKYPNNIKELIHLPIDMIGLIFYEKSARYAGDLPPAELQIVPPCIQKVGVFVNASEEDIFDKIRKYDLQAIQLHGDESPGFCRKIKKSRIKTIKAFQIEKAGDFEICNLYENACDYFLFDTKTSSYGGSGKKFDWEILSSYNGETPFILSGGIGVEDAESLRKIQNPKLHGIDLNSRFEIRAGEKDVENLRKFLSLLSSIKK